MKSIFYFVYYFIRSFFQPYPIEQKVEEIKSLTLEEQGRIVEQHPLQEKAKEEYAKLILVAEKKKEQSPLAQAVDLILQGDKYAALGDIRTAIYLYDKSIEVNETPLAFVKKSACQSQIGNINQAIKDAETSIQIDDKCWMGYNNLGVLLLNKKKYNDAIFYIEEAAHITEWNESGPIFNLGYAYECKKDGVSALKYYKQAYDLDPKSTDASKAFWRLSAMYN